MAGAEGAHVEDIAGHALQDRLDDVVVLGIVAAYHKCGAAIVGSVHVSLCDGRVDEIELVGGEVLAEGFGVEGWGGGCVDYDGAGSEVWGDAGGTEEDVADNAAVGEHGDDYGAVAEGGWGGARGGILPFGDGALDFGLVLIVDYEVVAVLGEVAGHRRNRHCPGQYSPLSSQG